MGTAQNQPKERLAIVFPPEPTPGALAVLVPESRIDEMKALEKDRQQRMWAIRGVISDHAPLSGSVADGLNRPIHNMFFLNENPISIYLHHGGSNAIYYDLQGTSDGTLRHVEVRVETDLPSKAFLYARQPLNELLDIMALTYAQMPLTLARLELVSPSDGGILAYEVILPFSSGVKFGPLGGIWQAGLFASYDAVLREAITSISPFYRFLCAYRVYDGIPWVRKRIKELCDQFSIKERMPKERLVEIDRLKSLGFTEEFCANIRTTADLFDRLRDLRAAVAHFLLDGEQGQVPLNMANGEIILSYSLAAGILLDYAAATIKDLRLFFNTRLQPQLFGGSILPGPELKDRFVVRTSR